MSRDNRRSVMYDSNRIRTPNSLSTHLNTHAGSQQQQQLQQQLQQHQQNPQNQQNQQNQQHQHQYQHQYTRVASDSAMYANHSAHRDSLAPVQSTIRIVSEPEAHRSSMRGGAGSMTGSDSSSSIAKRLSQVPSFLLPYPNSEFFSFNSPYLPQLPQLLQAYPHEAQPQPPVQQPPAQVISPQQVKSRLQPQVHSQSQSQVHSQSQPPQVQQYQPKDAVPTPKAHTVLKKPSNLKVNTSSSDPSSFSFSEHNDSIQDFQISPNKEEFEEPNVVFMDSSEKPNGHSSPLEILGSSVRAPGPVFIEHAEFSPISEGSSPSPMKSQASLGLIIGGYNYSGSSQDLKLKSSEKLREFKPRATSAIFDPTQVQLPVIPHTLLQGSYNLPLSQLHLSSFQLPYQQVYLPQQPQYHQLQQQLSPVKHARNSSESSTVSTSSTTSTITPSSAISTSKDKRFVRYVMNTTNKASSNASHNWNINRVILWLDAHNFNQSWKDTFKRNEISGNRFLELCNYETDSMIWKQFGKFLSFDNDFNTIQRFISLLKSESENPTPLPDEKLFQEGSVSSSILSFPHSRNSSNDSLSSTHLMINQIKAENRKSTPIFHKHKLSNGSINASSTGAIGNNSSSSSSGSLTTLTNQSQASTTSNSSNSNLNAHGIIIKPRPFSYIPQSSTTNMASQMKKEQQPYKFFRKHYRSNSNDTNQILETEFSSTPNSALSSSPHELPTFSKKKGTSLSLNDTFIANPSTQKGYGTQGVTTPTSSSTPTNNSKKERILSTFRKYGGDKVTEKALKKPNASVTSTPIGTPRNSMISVKNSSSSLEIIAPPTTSGKKPRRLSDNSISSNRSETSLNKERVSPILQSAIIPVYSDPPSIEITPTDGTNVEEILISSLEVLDEKYLPKTKETKQANHKVILVSKDNKAFFPIEILVNLNLDTNDPANVKQFISSIKGLIIKELDLINIGLITFHLTDFGSDEGSSLPEAKIIWILKTFDLPKFVIRQELSSPSMNTYSTTSSDSKSFELKGENNDEKFYPATPQYLLQSNNADTKTDYWNFKELANDRLSKIQESSRMPIISQTAISLQNMGRNSPGKTLDSNNFPLKLDKKTIQRKKPDPMNTSVTKSQPLLLIDTSKLPSPIKRSPSPNEIDHSPSATFRVIRKEGKEIDFDKRRKSPFETKAPKIIPNIYSSSVGTHLNSPIVNSANVQDDEDVISNNPQKNTHTFMYESGQAVVAAALLTRERSSSANSTASSIIAKRAPPPPPISASSSLKRSGSLSSRKTSQRTNGTGHTDELLIHSSRSNSSSDRSFSIRHGTNRTRGSSISRKTTMNREDPFVQNEITFEDIPHEIIHVDSNSSGDEDFFLKPDKGAKSSSIKLAKSDNFDEDDDDDFFMKPITPVATKKPLMNVRPPIDELYSNLEKYFPNTNLDKPIIDDSPVSPITPVVEPHNLPLYQTVERQQKIQKQPLEEQVTKEKHTIIKPNLSETTSEVTQLPFRKPTISRTFSNANISPVSSTPAVDSGEIFYSAENSSFPRRRMKTIRIVANEARKKRLEQQKKNSTSPKIRQLSDLAHKHSGIISNDSTVVSPESGVDLRRKNTKMWGQKVIEVTSREIEKGYVSKIRNNKNGEYVEFAWIKGELIGRGSFGAVYLALNVTTGEMLAVKQVEVPKENMRGGHKLGSKVIEGIEALHKEVETMKDLDHINIVQYLGFEQKQNIYSLFLEYVAGGSVAVCLKSYGPFEEQLVKFITRQVLLGLSYLHQNSIIHRDLKADNLLLEVDGVCKISDFGISKKSNDIYGNNAEMSMQGTIFWMAPEVIDSIVEDKKQGYSGKIDIWSLGCVVLEMFCGKRPWSNEAVVSAIYKIGKTKLAPPIPQDINNKILPEAKRFINECFTINPEMRPTAEELLKHDFLKKESDFQFENTKLAKIIKFNSKKSRKR